MKIRVRLFALARELAGADVVELELGKGSTIADVRRELAGAHPALRSIVPHVMFAVDSDYAADDASITPESEVACIPPVSGG